MLARLISARQTVILCDNADVHLFYRGQVYHRTGPSLGSLPSHKLLRSCPVWMLIDADLGSQGPPITRSSNVWPIHASSPSPDRWKSWKKQLKAVSLGMPKWNMDDLIQGCVFGLFSLSATDPGRISIEVHR